MAEEFVDPLGDASNLPDEICIHILSQLSCFELRNLRAVNKHYHNLVNVCFETRRNILRRTIAHIHSTVKSWNNEQPVPWNLTPETIDRLRNTNFEIIIAVDESGDFFIAEDDMADDKISCSVCHHNCNYVPTVLAKTPTADHPFCFRCVTTNLEAFLKYFNPFVPVNNLDNLLLYAVNYNVLRIMSGMGGLRYEN